MKKRSRLLTTTVVLAGIVAMLPSGSERARAQTTPQSLPLVGPSNLTYQGAFRLPNGAAPQDSVLFGGKAVFFSPQRRTLWVVGDQAYQRIAEVTVPRLIKGSRIEDYATGTFKQPFSGVLDGHLDRVGVQVSVKLAGLLPWGEFLVASAYEYYDAAGSQRKSHFRTSVNLSRTDDVRGPYAVGSEPAGFVSGYMALVPDVWKSALGGPAVTGNCCVPIISRTSLGPALSVFNPADVGTTYKVFAMQVLGYPIAHPTLGTCESSQQLFNCASGTSGVVFPTGTRSVLFFGRLGIGDYCYGTGGENGQCHDPTNPYKGPHAYPYVNYVWAYDVLDLIAVKQGAKKPWEVWPYQGWTFDLPFQDEAKGIRSVAFDPLTNRIFLSASRTGSTAPLVHVVSVKTRRR